MSCKDKINKTTKIWKTCEYCGNEFWVFPSMKSQRFCSRECYKNSKKPSLKICPFCKKTFAPNRSNQKFCSTSCRDNSMSEKETCICDYCGKEFKRKKSEIEKSKKHYCSEECKYNAIRWSKNDLRILKEEYGKIPNLELQSMLCEYHSVRELCRKALELDVGTSPFWTEEEISILKQNYEEATIEEMEELLPSRTKEAILGKAHSYHLINLSGGKPYSDEEINFLKENYLYMSNTQLANAINRTVNGISLKLYDLRLVRPFDVRSSSYPDLIKFVRRRSYSWSNNVKKSFDNKCTVTGFQGDVEIHHIRSFNLLMEETIEILNFPEYESFNDYSEEQLDTLMETFLNLQEKYHEYTCVSKDVHRLFHREYGYGDNTREQWNEFIRKYNNGYYNNIV